MLSDDETKWKELKGGYKVSYDPSSALRKLESGKEVQEAWDELWQELHHQGDIGEASYASVPHLVRIHQENGNLDWNLYALVSTIEIERHRETNPPIPVWLEPSYKKAWSNLLDLALQDIPEANDDTTLRAILGAIALAKGRLELGAVISNFEESELIELLDEYMGWSELYR